MKKGNLKDLIRGWFIGDFDRALYRTKDVEVAVQRYKAGDYEKKHVHKIATELSVVIKGKVLMNGREYGEGDIAVMEPGEPTDFKALTDAVNVVVKLPSRIGDKYFVDEKPIIFTHRGLEPSNPNAFPESSYEQFEHHIKRGFGIEFDLAFTKDGIVISHDSSLNRITGRQDQRKISELHNKEISKINSSIPFLSKLLSLIARSSVALHAIHFKGEYQNKENIERFLSELEKYPNTIPKLIVFDLKPEFAKLIKERIPEINLAASIAHSYDIERYGNATENTLLSIEEIISNKELYNWAWLDEWDTIDENGKKKRFYNKENLDRLREEGFKIALVTPELHGTSPSLIGGESHKDADTKESLFNRIKEIIELKPNALCTDYPEEVSKLLRGSMPQNIFSA